MIYGLYCDIGGDKLGIGFSKDAHIDSPYIMKPQICQSRILQN